MLDNVRSAWNVGSILRTADGAGISQVHLCGVTPPGDHPKVVKTALGAEKSVCWTYHTNSLEAARSLIEGGRRLWALEFTPGSVPIWELKRLPQEPLVLVVGNEVVGVDPELLGMCERAFHLPMGGSKRSYNVAVAFGMAAVYLLGL